MADIIVLSAAPQFSYFLISANTVRLYKKFSKNQLLKRTTWEKPQFTEHALKELILIPFNT